MGLTSQIIRIVSCAAGGSQSASLQQESSTNWKIFRALGVLGAASVVAKLATMIKELVIADRFGRNDSIDAFLIAMVLPVAVTGLVASSFTGALVPSYIRVRESDGLAAAQQLLSSVQALNLCLLAIVLLMVAAGAPYYLPLLGSGFGSAKLLLTRHLVYLVLVVILLNGVATVWASVLNAHEGFALPAMTPAITSTVYLFALIFLVRRWGIFALAGGAVAGAALEAFVLGWALRLRGISLKVRWYGLTPELRVVIRQYLPTLLGLLVLGISAIIDQSMAAMLSPGSVAALNYGYRIVGSIVSLTSAALSTAMLPYLSLMVAKRNWSGCRHTLKTYSLLVLLATIPVSVALVATSGPLVRMLFQRGAFTASDTAVVSVTQVFFAISIPFASWGTLFVRLLSSLQRSDLLAYTALLSAGLNIFFNIIFMERWGVAGIALSTSLVCALSCVFMGFSAFILLRKRKAKDTDL